MRYYLNSSSSKPFNQEKKFELDNFIKYISELWLKVKLSNNFFKSDKYWNSGCSPKQRADDINSMFADKNIDAIWCYQGWNTINQTLDLIDFNIVKNNPKLILWKSDVDVLLLVLNKKIRLITIHCCDPKIWSNKELDFEYNKKWFYKRLFEGSKKIKPSEEWICYKEWKAEGKLLGCNISSILKLAGTEYFPDFTDSILFIETYKSSPDKLLFQLTQLKQLAVFEKVKWIVIGHNFWFESNKFTVEEIVSDFLENYDLPILKINEFWHYQPHTFLPIWAKIKLDATNKKLEIVDDFIV